MADQLAAVIYGKHDLRMEPHATPEPGAKDVEIAVQRCGMCVTDNHMLETGGIGEVVIKSPYVIGHEFNGIITKTGSDVTNVVTGDRVAVDSVMPCAECRMCKMGFHNVCSCASYIGFGNHGGLARTATVPASIAYKLPDSLEFEDAALLEPLSVCVNGVNRADIKEGDSVMVFGAGPIGLLTLQVALARGASSVCVAEVNPERLTKAKELGATHTVLFTAGDTDPKLNAQTLRAAIGREADVTMECSGTPLCLQTAVFVTRPRGVVAVIGLGPDDVTMPINDVALREIDVRGCVANNKCFPEAIKLAASGQVQLQPIISHRVPLEDVPRAIRLAAKREVLKIVVDCTSRKQ